MRPSAVREKTKDSDTSFDGFKSSSLRWYVNRKTKFGRTVCLAVIIFSPSCMSGLVVGSIRLLSYYELNCGRSVGRHRIADFPFYPIEIEHECFGASV